MSPVTDTIVAIVTPPGRGAVGALRLSGPQSLSIAKKICGELPHVRHVALRRFRASDGAVLDQGLVLVFSAPHSFTGEDVVELQGHGGPVVLQLLLRTACEHGARPARPGEFSERAFLNDRLDLAQAEAISDLIDAASEDAVKAAQRSLDGEFSARVHALNEELIQLRIFVEGALDFSDEDVNWLADEGLHSRLSILLTHFETLQTQAAQGRRLREGITVTLTGQPNVGKSTLLNRLAGADAAIVTEIAGTTRDVLRENILLKGLPLTIVDTAGLRESDDPVEREGIRRAWQALEQAEIALFLLDGTQGLTNTDRALLAKIPATQTVLVLHNKCDRSGELPRREKHDGRVHLYLSAKTGAGVEGLVEEILRIAGFEKEREGIFSARARHLDALRRAQAHTQQAQYCIQSQMRAEIAAEELRLSQNALGEITGTFRSDDLLGRIFSQFCIGK